MTLEDALAQAICNAFWETCEYKERWETTPPLKRQVFTLCARRAIEAATAFREAQKARAA